MATSFTTLWSDAELRGFSGPAKRSHGKSGHQQSDRLSTLNNSTTRGRRVSGKRKRSEAHAVQEHPLESSPLATPYVRSQRADIPISKTPASLGPAPAALVNERYRTASGVDTPGMSTAVMTMQLHDTPELANYRTSWSANDRIDTTRVTPLGREVNGRPRISIESADQGWTTSAYGVVGKVFQFCYNMLPTLSKVGTTETLDAPEDFDSWRRSATPLPGMYPEEDIQIEVDDTPIRPAKRIHTGSGNGWVMVERDASDSVVRLSPRKLSATMSASASPQSTASRASSRRPIAPRSRKSISQVSFTGSPAVPSQPVAVSSHRRRASTASTRSPSRAMHSTRSQRTIVPRRSVPDFGADPTRSSLSPEAQKLLNQRSKRERDADKSMRKMSKQVQDLIRQGQQALGSNIEVDEEDGSDAAMEL